MNAAGRRLPLLCNAAPIRDGQGAIAGGIVAWRDISALKQAEAEIRHLASFPEANPNPVLEIDRQGAVTYANSGTAAWLERLGCPGDSRTFLPADIGALRQTMGLGMPAQVYREVTVGRAIFGEDASTGCRNLAFGAFTPATSPSASGPKTRCARAKRSAGLWSSARPRASTKSISPRGFSRRSTT